MITAIANGQVIASVPSTNDTGRDVASIRRAVKEIAATRTSGRPDIRFEDCRVVKLG